MLSEKPWPPEQVLQLLIRLFASMFIGILLISWFSATKWFNPEQIKLITLLIGTLSFHGAALVLIASFLRAQGMSWDQAFGFRSPGVRRVVLTAIAIGVGVLPIAWSLGQLSAKIMSWFHIQPALQSPVEMLESAGSLQMKLFIGLLAIIVAPLAEELVFRGLIYPTLKQHGLPRLALWGTSLLFAIIHSNLMIVLPLTFLAVMLTLLYEATNNLLASILAHSVFNFINFFWVVTQPLTLGTP